MLTLLVVRPEEIRGSTVVCVSLPAVPTRAARPAGEIRRAAAAALGLVEGESLYPVRVELRVVLFSRI